jgi:hypothetical protein
MARGASLLFLVASISVAACSRRHIEERAIVEPFTDVRATELSPEESAAVTCAMKVGGERNLVAHAIPISVSKGPRFRGEPPDWRSGGEWSIRFVERDLPPNSRDGAFSIVVRMPACRALQIVVPG